MASNEHRPPPPPSKEWDEDNYTALAGVFDLAMEQAAQGKGAERHASGERFEEQVMVRLTGLYGLGFPFGQVAKKCQEAARMVGWEQPDRAVAEILGAMNYLAGAVIAIHNGDVSPSPQTQTRFDGEDASGPGRSFSKGS